MYDTILTFIKFNNFGTWCVNEPKHLFHSFCCTIWCIFDCQCVNEPRFNMDKYSTVFPWLIHLGYHYFHALNPNVCTYVKMPHCGIIWGCAIIFKYTSSYVMRFLLFDNLAITSRTTLLFTANSNVIRNASVHIRIYGYLRLFLYKYVC